MFTRASRLRPTLVSYRGEDYGVRSFEHFYLSEQGPGRWLIHHAITDEPAGSLLRTPGGFRLTSEHGTTLGTFPSIDEAILGLYAVA